MKLRVTGFKYLSAVQAQNERGLVHFIRLSHHRIPEVAHTPFIASY